MAGGERSERDDLLLADVARRYYLEDLTQEQIARGLGVSRSNVSRMLKEARERGLVEIRIHHPLRRLADLEASLSEALELRECLVLAAPGAAPGMGDDPPPAVAPQIGALAARYLQERIVDGNVLGVGWGSTVYHVATSDHLRRKAGTAVVQLMGSMGGATPDIDGAQIAGRLGRALGGRVYLLHAPMVVAEAAVRTGLLRDPHIRATLEMARRADVLLVSVGAVTRASGIYRAGYLSDADLEYIQGQGAVGDICGSYYKRDGSPCSLELEERTIAATAEAMRRAPLRVGVGWGVAKALPSLGAVRAGLINVLIVDEDAAREVLREIGVEGTGAGVTPPESDA